VLDPEPRASTQGSILGSVKDAQGAVIPNAVVTLTNTDEGTVRSAKSNGVGDYRFQDVKSGHYAILVSAPAFEKWAISGVVLDVRQELRVDAKLSIGTVQQEVQVTGDMVSAIETDTPTISGTFTADDTNNLPSIHGPVSAAPALPTSSARCPACRPTATVPAFHCKAPCRTRSMSPSTALL